MTALASPTGVLGQPAIDDAPPPPASRDPGMHQPTTAAPRKRLGAVRAERLLRATHRRVMRRTGAAIAALDSIAPGEFRADRPDVDVACRLSDEAHRTARAVRRRVWGPWA